MSKPKILIFDIETAPTLAYVWRAYKENVGLKQIVENGYMMSFSAKWLGAKEVFYYENRHNDDTDLVQHIIHLFDEADIVVAHNAKKFDIPTVLGRAVVHGFAPPSPYKVVDTLIVAKQRFRFFQNSLAYLSNILGVEEKDTHKDFPGFELWWECLKDNEAAWKEMKAYNIQDTLTLEQVYLRMLPYIHNHPNVGVYMEEDVPVCPKCGSKHINYRGYYNTNVGKYRKFQCQECGGWGHTRHTEYPKDKRKALITGGI